MASAGPPKVWFAARIGVSLIFTSSLLLFQILRRKRDSREIQEVIDKFSTTEDGLNLEGEKLTSNPHLVVKVTLMCVDTCR